MNGSKDPFYGGEQIFTNNTIFEPDDSSNFEFDRNWSKNAFLTPDDTMSVKLGSTTTEPQQYDIENRYWSSANFKFTSTRLGGNIGINPRPQFTPYADIPVKGRLGTNRDIDLNSCERTGMGRYYSEAIDDSSQTVYFRFGVPQHNAISNFFTNAFSTTEGTYARTGKFPFMFAAAKAVATVSTAIAFPGAALLVLSYKTVNFFLKTDCSYRYYTLKPTMHMYWGTVQTLVNTLAVNLGIMPKMFADDLDKAEVIGRVYKLDSQYLSILSDMMPDVFPAYDSEAAKAKPTAIIDIYAAALKGQRIANAVFKEEFDRLENDQLGAESDITGLLQKTRTGVTQNITSIKSNFFSDGKSFSAWLNELITFGDMKLKDDKEPSVLDPRAEGADPETKKSWGKDFKNYLDAEIRDGSQFASFRVDATGAVSESFSNATTESSISQKLNGLAGDGMSKRFSLAEGNVIGGVAGAAVDTVVGGAKDVATGLLSGFTFGLSENILSLLSGIGYIDIPKVWQNSNASLPKANYTIQLISPYGNAFSMLQNIYIPLAMILAGALPRSTGKASYTSPFLCQVFDRGRVQIRLGMIESVSITRGTSNLAFNLKGVPLAIDVNISVVDLSSIMHMPVTSGGLLDFDTTIDESNILCDYLAVLAGQDLNSQMYAIPKAKMKLAKSFAELGKITSPAYWASNIGDTIANRLPFIYGPINAAVAQSNMSAGASSAAPG